jgi:hypothetical protein
MLARGKVPASSCDFLEQCRITIAYEYTPSYYLAGAGGCEMRMLQGPKLQVKCPITECVALFATVTSYDASLL